MKSYLDMPMKFISFLLLVLVGYQCSTTNSSDNTVHAFGTVVYGDITGVDESNYDNIRVGLSVHKDGCETPVGYEEIAPVQKSGAYQYLFRSFFNNTENICHQVTLLYVEGQEESTDSMQIISKKIQANWKENPPYDSVRVEFDFEKDMNPLY